MEKARTLLTCSRMTRSSAAARSSDGERSSQGGWLPRLAFPLRIKSSYLFLKARRDKHQLPVNVNGWNYQDALCLKHCTRPKAGPALSSSTAHTARPFQAPLPATALRSESARFQDGERALPRPLLQPPSQEPPSLVFRLLPKYQNCTSRPRYVSCPPWTNPYHRRGVISANNARCFPVPGCPTAMPPGQTSRSSRAPVTPQAPGTRSRKLLDQPKTRTREQSSPSSNPRPGPTPYTSSDTGRRPDHVDVVVSKMPTVVRGNIHVGSTARAAAIQPTPSCPPLQAATAPIEFTTCQQRSRAAYCPSAKALSQLPGCKYGAENDCLAVFIDADVSPFPFCYTFSRFRLPNIRSADRSPP